VVSGWIENDLSQFLSTTPPDDPVFVLVNLLDAHEPYFGVLSDGSGTAPDWLWAYSGPLDRSGWREGRRAPTPRDVARIARLYRAGAELVDRRLGNLLSAFESSRDLAQTDVVVLGDHGQALGEQGRMYHVHGTVTSMLRVPLIVRTGGRTGRGRIDTWVSLTDSMRLLAADSPEIATVLGPVGEKAVTESPDRSEASVAALVDGPPPPAARLSRPPRPGSSSPREQAVVVFSGDMKLVVDVATGKATLNDAEAEGAGDPVELGHLSRPGALMYQTAGPILERVRHLLAEGDSANQERRLSSWGY
jgi:hypothetical protein